MKPYNLKTDYHIQSILVIVNITIAISAIFFGNGVLFFLFILQFCGGCVQLIGSGMILSICPRNNPFFKWRQKHFWGSLVYIAVLVILPFMDFGISPIWSYIYFSMLFGIPQIIFYAYFIMTIREMNYWKRMEETTAQENISDQHTNHE